MNIKKLALTAAIGLSMASTPVMAQSAEAARTGAALEQASGQRGDRGDMEVPGRGPFGGGAPTFVLAFLATLFVGLGIYFAVDDGEDGTPSP